MENEDKELRDFFRHYNPPTASSTKDFMGRLNRSMDSVEMIRARQKAIRRRNRLALVGATSVGFMAGFTLALFLPTISGLLTRLTDYLPDLSSSSREMTTDVLSYILIGVITVSVSLATYEGIRRGNPLKI